VPAAARGRRRDIVKALPCDARIALEEAIELFEPDGFFLDPFLAVVDRAAVMRRNQEEADGFRRVALEQIAEGARPFRLADLAGLLGALITGLGGAGVAAADLSDFGRRLHQPVVHPVFRLRLAVAAFALRDFVLVMREDEIEPPAVNIKRLTENPPAHGGAFDVPAGASLSPRAIPRRLAGLGAFPQGKIGGRSFALGHAAPFALQGVDVAAAELAVLGVFAYFEIDVSLALVGKTLLDQPLDE